MENKLTTKEDSVVDQELINEAKSLTGQSNRLSVPFIPIIRVNNKKELKKVTVDGKEKEVKILPDAGFTITKKNEMTGEYTTDLFSNTLEAVVLRIRYKIQEKFDRTDPKKKLYYSYDFDMNDPDIKVFDGNKEIASGNYKELKERFKTGENDSGFPTKSFDLIMILYIHLGDDVYRFERKVTMNDAWYEYEKSFPQNDTYVGYKTRFLLTKDTAGDNEYWRLSFEKGEAVELMPEVKMQREINKFFQASNVVRQKEDLPVIQVEDNKESINESQIDIEQVPF